MKKIISIFICAILFACLIPIAVHADGPTGDISLSKSSVKKGEKFYVSFVLSGNTETIGSMSATIFYDMDAFECSLDPRSDYFTTFLTPNAMGDGTVRVSVSGGSEALASGTLVRLAFTVKDTAVEGANYTFGIGSKGRTTLLVTKSGGVPGDIISGPASTAGEIVYSSSVYVLREYTVTYTDGVPGETVFADQTYSAYENAATPSFSGWLSRPGYEFAGWSPAVSSTVTGSVTYTAQWIEVPEYTVTYTDGVYGETIFEDQIYTVYENDDTPEFSGSLSRPGYLFAGWSPEVSDTVTDSVTYTAQWTAIPKYTVTYTDGVYDEVIFADQSYNIEGGNATPAFVGIPERAGYTFEGWEPKVADTVTASVTYTAKWHKIEFYTVRYTDGVADEVVFDDQVYSVIENGDTPAFVGTPSRPGYTFVKWTPEVVSKVIESVTYTAEWLVNPECTVTYTDGVAGETIFADKVFTVNSGMPTPAFGDDPVRAGYVFKGWSPALVKTVTSDVIYSATWEKETEVNKYTVTYIDGVADEKIFADVTFEVPSGSATPAYPGTPTRDGYIFKGWNPEVAATVTANVTYTATWEKVTTEQKYTVIYTDGVADDEIFADVTFDVASGSETPAYPGTPTRDGYVFKGWNPEVAATVTANVTYTATWEKVTAEQEYTVIYTDGVPGIVIFADKSIKVSAGSATPAFGADPVREGYIFKGWYPAVEATVTANITYTAIWEQIAPTQTYVVRYTDGVNGQEVFPDQSYTADAGGYTPAFEGNPTRDGYIFKGWNPAVSATVTANVTYTATWEKVSVGQEYTVVYTDGVPGTEIFDDKSIKAASGTPTPAFGNDPVRDGYIFKGWYPAVEATVTANITYTAVWEQVAGPQTYVVRYNDGVNGQEVFPDQVYTVTAGGAMPAFDGTPTRDGYIFKGWNAELPETVTASVTYYAIWEQDITVPDPAKFTVRYTDGVSNLTLFEDQVYSVEKGSRTPGFLGSPVREGYVFKGWNPEVSERVECNVTYTATWEKIEIDETTFPWWIIPVVAVVALAVGCYIGFVIYKNKKQTEDEKKN